jgi:hypothetical protein
MRRLYRDSKRDANRRLCPPHVPSVAVREGDGYRVECLGCGLCGPKRGSPEEAKLAYDEVTESWREGAFTETELSLCRNLGNLREEDCMSSVTRLDPQRSNSQKGREGDYVGEGEEPKCLHPATSRSLTQ